MAVYPSSESDRRVRRENLRSVVAAIFERCGMTAADAGLLAETLVFSDRRGVHSHGVIRVPEYVRKLTAEGVDPRGVPSVVSKRGSALVVDGGNSMGQIGGTFAMDQAIATAREHGVAFAALRGSNHCGALDWYALRAVAAGMIGICGTNALPTMAPVGGIEKIVGINPLAVGIPGGDAPFVLDFAFGATAHGKIRIYDQKGSPIPAGWAFDENGDETTDAATAMRGLIQPIGGHKGVGLGMMVGMLSTLLSGAAYGTELGNMVDGPKPGVDGQFLLAIDVAAFVDPAELRRRVDAIIGQIHYSRRRDGVDRLFVPGEIERDFEASYDRDGIVLAGATVDDIVAEASRLGVDAAPLFAGAAPPGDGS